MKLVSLAFCLLALGACTKTGPVLTPIQQVGCSIETAISGGIASSVTTALNCTNGAAVQASLQTAFGNANLCVSTAPFQVKGQMKTQGIVGNIACPIAVNAAIGFLTNSIPTAWGCSQGTTASALASALTAACEAAIPL